jgi:alpha-galactosidase
VAVQDLVVRAVLEGQRDHVYHAAMLDRHAGSVLSLKEIQAMVDEMLQAHASALPEELQELDRVDHLRTRRQRLTERH